MLIIPPKGVSGPAISTSSIKHIHLSSSYLTFSLEVGLCYWQAYPSDTNMEEEFHRVCNEVNSLLTKPTIQL